MYSVIDITISIKFFSSFCSIHSLKIRNVTKNYFNFRTIDALVVKHRGFLPVSQSVYI